ncbi:cell division protein FtsZ [Erythromicrobium ramosum]|uniref:Cell division protein FtsZ n=1 Tax=Erythrobacter ramosus TaxID=35811 RepID=A0A6I4UPZ2_9SPHN|nr:cell division protein FtsZ [Erythrobacter ramosus]MBB3776837.1 cell division protein FtsZ [Erythrobacter ramosus]MXP39689.1 cell division protein FtsZ [Erythrobacter ramosus]
MSINIGPAVTDDLRPRITVIGIGGAGGNAIANMIAAEIEGVEFIVANTDAQALATSPAERRIQLGPDITGGLGAGARPEVGKAAAEETVAEIERALEGVNMCFIAAGMGGGTGTGAAPVIAEAARRMGVLTVGVVTKPFLFEGTRRMRAAEAGIEELQSQVDTLIVIPNQNLFLVAKAETTFKEAFQLADEVLQQGVRSITDLMVMPGLINLDFADVRSVMSEMGKAMMGTGEGEGENRALDAAEQAIANPLLDGVSMAGARGVIISIIGGEDMRLLEVDEAANHIRELVDEDANIIWGSAFNPDLKGKIRVSVVATGIEQSAIGHVERSHSVSLGASRAPKRPVLELSEDEGLTELPPVDEAPEPEAPAAYEPPAAPAPAPAPVSYDEETLDLSDEAEDADYPPAAPFELSGMQAGDDYSNEYDDDVDDIVDPLAGLRGADEAGPYGEPVATAPAPAADNEGTLDLGESYSAYEDEPVQDDLLANADRLAAQDRPVEAKLGGGRRRSLLGGGSEDGGSGGGSGAGSTLFERMANLSRSNARDDEEDDDGDDGPALSIPRFLGRQNNQ